MIKAYINYPNSHFTLHSDSTCPNVRTQRKTSQRIIQIDKSTISIELRRFSERHYSFAAEARLNDMWLHIDFGDRAFEEAVAEHIKKLLSKRYKPFASAKTGRHC